MLSVRAIWWKGVCKNWTLSILKRQYYLMSRGSKTSRPTTWTGGYSWQWTTSDPKEECTDKPSVCMFLVLCMIKTKGNRRKSLSVSREARCVPQNVCDFRHPRFLLWMTSAENKVTWWFFSQSWTIIKFIFSPYVRVPSPAWFSVKSIKWDVLYMFGKVPSRRIQLCSRYSGYIKINKMSIGHKTTEPYIL